MCNYDFKWYEEIPVVVHFQSCVLYFINVFNFLQLNSVGVASRLKTRSSKDECGTGDQTIILGLQIFLDHRSLSSKKAKYRIELKKRIAQGWMGWDG